uniref:probable glycosyltransferase At5g20260 isoform X2 n=1 Tax=Fragaria vesca subsp. vesca TaxID=101020 RepID=UPI0005C885BA|nr:PREDICTED: probable glycosyltransferase At5g20260 isoform X2 [Fragaria vesca subsp. vesca]
MTRSFRYPALYLLIILAFVLLLLIFAPLLTKNNLISIPFLSFLTSTPFINPDHFNYTITPPQVCLDEFLTGSRHPIRRSRHDVNGTKAKNKTSLERLEEGLAKARASILDAIRFKNYTSEREETFIPRGSIYKNPYAFHQSHIEMIKRFKIWSYKEGERPLVHLGPMYKRKYDMEGYFIDEIEREEIPFRAKHPDEAHMFFLPFSVAFIVDYVYEPIITREEYHPNRLQQIVMDYVTVVAHKYPYWNRTNGADHFMVSCHDWGRKISVGHSELYKNFVRVLCNANTSEGFEPRRDVSLPQVFLQSGEPGPSNLAHQSPRSRRTLAFYAGGAHGLIRAILLHHWKGKDNKVQVYETVPESMNYTALMEHSKFCLCPSGTEVATPRVVEAIYAGCVPVIISDNYTLPLSDVLNWSQFSVNIAVAKIPEIKTILQAIPNEEYLKMQRRVLKVQRHFVLNKPAKPFDVIHMVLHSVWLRRLNFKIET